MPRIADNLTDLIGGTPLLRLRRISRGAVADLVMKVESLNPGGSIKDRIGYNMILRAEEEGLPAGISLERRFSWRLSRRAAGKTRASLL